MYGIPCVQKTSFWAKLFFAFFAELYFLAERLAWAVGLLAPLKVGHVAQ
jgi:hypothetical protein